MSKPPPPSRPDADLKQLRHSRREGNAAARPNAEAHRRMFTGARIYVCRRCQVNFKTGEGQPDARTPGFGKCDSCLSASTGSKSLST